MSEDDEDYFELKFEGGDGSTFTIGEVIYGEHFPNQYREFKVDKIILTEEETTVSGICVKHGWRLTIPSRLCFRNYPNEFQCH